MSEGPPKGQAGEQSIDEEATKPVKRDIIYSVQVGALKNKAEAESLMSRLGKKGYKTYMTIAKGKKQEKIYKVKTGEFREKKSAEVLAVKLKKTEGLKTYVTTKSE
jgi:cell division septation protein DedD